MPASPEFADRAAYLPDADALVCADVHLGRDAGSNVELPLGEPDRIPSRLEALLDRFAPAELVLAGDTVHAFDDVTEGVAESLAAIESLAADAGTDLVFVEGNHDAMLPAVTDRPIAEHHRLADDTVVLHGDEAPDETATAAGTDRYVIGHEHPAIVVEGQRHPCYLHGPAVDRDASVLVLPPFNRLARGTVVNGDRGGLGTPLVDSLERYRPAVLEESAGEVLWFPPLGQLRQHL